MASGARGSEQQKLRMATKVITVYLSAREPANNSEVIRLCSRVVERSTGPRVSTISDEETKTSNAVFAVRSEALAYGSLPL